MPIGLLLLIAAFVALAAPMIFAFSLIVDGHYLVAGLLLPLSAWWMPLCWRWIGWLLRGIEHSSL